MAKLLYRKDTGEILGVHIIGLHAADLIHEASNAIATNQTVQVRLRHSAGSKTQVQVVGGVLRRAAGTHSVGSCNSLPGQLVRHYTYLADVRLTAAWWWGA
jgi:hypothetical protein